MPSRTFQNALSSPCNISFVALYSLHSNMFQLCLHAYVYLCHFYLFRSVLPTKFV